MPNHLVASLTAAIALSSSSVLAQKQYLRAADVLLTPYDSIAQPLITTGHIRRQTESGTGAPTNATDSDGEEFNLLNPDGSMNMTAWNIVTGDACLERLSELERASNPSGASICYNLPTLDAATGIFEADLRVYRVSDARTEWVGIDAADIAVQVGYRDATVDSITEEDVRGVGMVGELSTAGMNIAGVSKRQDGGGGGGPELMQQYMLVGQINPGQVTADMSMAEMEALVLPILGLSATPPDGGENLTTTVTPNEAAFLTGVFSDQVVLSDFAAAQAAFDAQMSRLEAGEIAFVVPGTRILLFPIGLVITGVWALVGIAVYGFGTYERYTYVQMYKERKRIMETRGTSAAWAR